MTERLTPGTLLPGIPASTWNQFIDTTKTVAQLRDPHSKLSDSRGASALRLLVENTTAANITAEFPVLAIDGPVFNPTDRAGVVREGINFKGKTPDAQTKITDIVIVQGPIPNGAFRPAVLRGPTWCEIDVTDAAHTHAKPKSGDNTKLESSTSGLKIEWKESGTGTKKAIVILGESEDKTRRVRGTVVESVVGPGTATFTLNNLVAIYGEKPATATITVHHVFNHGYQGGMLAEAQWNDELGRWENTSRPIIIGCHLVGDPSTGALYVDAASLAGTGLGTETGPGGCLRLRTSGTGTDYEAGCGILFVTPGGGTALTDIEVDRADLMGCGLTADDDHGPCGIKVDVAAIAGECLEADTSSGNCKLSVDTNILKGIQCGVDGLEAKLGPGLEFDGSGNIKIDKDEVTIKVPTSIELNLVGSTLEVKLNYTNYTVYGTAGTTGDMSDTVATTTCP